MSKVMTVDRPTPEQQRFASEGLASAERVLRQEATALTLLADSLNEHFPRALDLLMAVSGRVVVTGMGKSGHIAHKIAATLASTGTPSQFVHPAEASHGDLGMVTPKDAVLALSNSGETAELSDLINYTRRWHIPLIGITSGAGSALGSAADVTLALPKVTEAGTLGLAPTTSTTMMLALGDAIAVALLERKGFSVEDFKQFHPGGNLGQRLLRVAELMHVGSEIPLVAEDAVMSVAILEMTAKTFGCVGAIDAEGRLTGIITDGDLRRHMGKDLLEMRAVEVMTHAPVTIRASALAAEALGIMNDRSITSLFVLEDERPIGIIRLHDCLRAGLV
ncbi:SIS domain-containing protein [Dongia soli]|uniref:KpsF/GutQ family sugar-phosphate isomerase n=1 Tax=Dongia soli TaxID=600628 RepID=A0ABU5E887_9PROT|nr:KpsF/GutQ family sugar-phosphate isomerase [Dongia soli]MDY0881778.1 KpsF/GutQ family sugar-phosphate isomerase [Dongia soli]